MRLFLFIKIPFTILCVKLSTNIIYYALLNIEAHIIVTFNFKILNMKYTDEILKLAELYQDRIEKEASKWKKMPPGWKSKSRKNFFSNLADESVGECMKRIKDHVDDPGAFCASLKDRVKKTTKWREGKPENLKKKRKKKASADIIDQTIQNYMLNMYQLSGGRLYGMTPAAAPDYTLNIIAYDTDTYDITVTARLEPKNGYDGAFITNKKGIYIPESNKIASQKTKEMYKKQFTSSLSNLLDDEFEIDYTLNITIL